MAKKKDKGDGGTKTFPKPQGEEGAPDRFIAPDRPDQIQPDPEDRPTIIQVKDISEGLEVIEDDVSQETDDRDDLRSEDDDDDGEGRGQRRRARRDDDSREYNSRSVQRRINRERALREQDRVRAENAERRARRVEERLAKLERVTTEVANSNDIKALEAKLKDIKEKLAKAIEDGKTSEQMELTIQLGDVQADIKLKQRDLEAARRKQIDDEARSEEIDDTGADANPGRSGGTEEWIRANRGWFNKRAFQGAQQDAISVDKEILEEIASGDADFERYSDEHFIELNRRMARLYPDLELFNPDGSPYEAAENEEDVSTRDRDRDRDARDTRQNGSSRPPAGGFGPRANGRRQQSAADLARQGKVKLEEADYSTMRLFGLNPADEEHKKRFARERMRTILTDDRRQNGRAR